MNRKSLTCINLMLLVLLMTATLLAGITKIEGQTSQTIVSYTYLAVNPNPAGVGQQVQVTAWILPLNPMTRETTTLRDRFYNVTVTVTAPDGNSRTMGPFTGDPNGNIWFTYTPNTVGNYTLVANYPGDKLSPGQFLPSQSPVTKLVVQQNPLPSFQDTPLPTQYWTRPINGQNRLWASISGDWLMASYSLQYKTAAGVSVGAYNPYSQAPRAPHIMWTKEIATGGLVGGDQKSNTYYSGASYRSMFSPPIIMDGKLYYNTNSLGLASGTGTGFVCVDLRTGQQLWENTDGKSLTCGQEWYAQKYSYTNAGVMPFLWTTSWEGYNPANGKWMFNFTNYPSSLSRPVFSDDGSMLVYLLGKGWLAMWNSSLIRPTTGTYNWTNGLQYNVTVPLLTVPTSLYSIISISSNPNPSILGVQGNVLIASVGATYHTVYQMGYDLTTKTQLWVNNYTQNILNLGPYPTYWPALGDGVLAQYVMHTRSWYGYDVNTGALLWTSEQQDYPWGTWESYYPTIANGKLYSLAYDGKIYAFDVKNGKQVWSFSSENSGSETASGTYAFFYGPIIADGVVFAGVGFETPSQPLFRGAKVYGVDANTGKQIWNMTGMMYLRAIADGYLLGVNVYDAQLYCIGMGPSKTTVAAPQSIINLGSKILLTGTVTDIASGTKSEQVAANFPNGLPVASDASMSELMEAAYMQQPMPNNIIGVKVHLTASDPNNNFQDIGTATSNADGTYAISWTPPVPGVYHVTATFEGSNACYPSSGATYFLVGSAPSGSVVTPLPSAPLVTPAIPSQTPLPSQPASPTALPTQAPPPATMDMTATYSAVSAAVVIIAVVVAAVVLRKRK
jgi:outer membrane protein assembly factor BamB